MKNKPMPPSPFNHKKNVTKKFLNTKKIMTNGNQTHAPLPPSRVNK